MKVYYVEIYSHDEGFEGGDHYFPSLEAAQKFAREFTKEQEDYARRIHAEQVEKYGAVNVEVDWKEFVKAYVNRIDRLQLAELPAKQLVLACLNQRAFVAYGGRKNIYTHHDS